MWIILFEKMALVCFNVVTVFFHCFFSYPHHQVLKKEAAAAKRGFQYDLSGAKEIKTKQPVPDKKRGSKR